MGAPDGWQTTPRPQETVSIHTTGSEASIARHRNDNVPVFLLFPDCLRESPPGGVAKA